MRCNASKSNMSRSTTIHWATWTLLFLWKPVRSAPADSSWMSFWPGNLSKKSSKRVFRVRRYLRSLKKKNCLPFLRAPEWLIHRFRSLSIPLRFKGGLPINKCRFYRRGLTPSGPRQMNRIPFSWPTNLCLICKLTSDAMSRSSIRLRSFASSLKKWFNLQV